MKRLLLLPLVALTLASASAVTVASTSTPDSISYMPVLLNQPEIHKDLKISPVQDARINVIRAECRAKVGVTLEFKKNWNTAFFYNAAAGNNDLVSQNIFWSVGAKF